MAAARVEQQQQGETVAEKAAAGGARDVTLIEPQVCFFSFFLTFTNTNYLQMLHY
jgi:hypothetical protein